MDTSNAQSSEQPRQPPKANGGVLALRILNLTDLHMAIRGYDYFADQPSSGGGLARAATLIEQLKQDAPNTLLFDNGDFLQGNPMGDFMVREFVGGRMAIHPMVAAFNALGLDAAAIGNHEFNYGLGFLTNALRGANFPFVSANITFDPAVAPDQIPPITPFVILDREVRDGSGKSHTIRIGVVGFLPPQTINWDRRHLEGRADCRGIVEAAQAVVPQMQAAGADIIIALSHSGIDDTPDRAGLENASVPLAAVPGIDVVIAGHSHQVFPSDAFRNSANINASAALLHGKPATMAGVGGSHVGVVDLFLTRQDARWHINNSRAFVQEVSSFDGAPGPAEKTILQTTQAAHEATLAYIRKPLAKTEHPYHSYFAMLEPSGCVLLIATAQTEVLRADLRETEYANVPLLSAAAPFKLGGLGGPRHFTDVPVGEMSIRSVSDIYGYPNILNALLVDGLALRNWLEFSAGYFNRIEPGKPDQLLVDPRFPAHNFDTITGLTYQIDVTAPARFSPEGKLLNSSAERIRDLRHAGQPVADSQNFVVATNDYRASQSGTYPGADQGRAIPTTPTSVFDILVHHLQMTPPDRGLARAPWSLVPAMGASVTIETGPGAQNYPDDVNRLGLEQLLQLDDGFLGYRKTF